ncbi:MAG: VWA domain-containing protein [Candidatus Limnocylindrales bacterium]
MARPDGTSVDLVPGSSGGAAVTFAGTDQPGLYTVTPIVDPAASSAHLGTPTAATDPDRPSPRVSPGASSLPDDPLAPVQFAVALFDVDEIVHRARIRGGHRGPGHDHLTGIRRRHRPDRATDDPRRTVGPHRAARAPGAERGVGALPPRWARPHPSWTRDATGSACRWPRLMGVSFEAPVALLLLIPALALTFALYLGSRRRIGVGRRRIALVVRTLLISALVLALAGFRLVLPVDRLATVFVVDLSDSVGNAGREDALAFLRESLALRPDDDVAGIVAFGKEALVERLPADLDGIDRIASTPVRSATDIEAALRLASALFPDDAQKRIVLLSDGNDTTGGGQSEAALAATRGVRVETRLIGLGSSDEVLVERLTTPSTARLGESIEAIAEIRSSVAQPATLRLFADGKLVATQPVSLEAGVTRVAFDVTPKEAGFHTFRVVVEAARDTFSQNDRADSNTIVNGEPRTLVLAGNQLVAAELVAALKAQGQQVDTIVPEALPTDFAQLATYDSVVLVDVPRIRLSDRQLAALQVHVRDLGKGLVMIGGPDSYGAGGYQKTPLEASCPWTWACATARSSPMSRSSWSSISPVPWTPAIATRSTAGAVAARAWAACARSTSARRPSCAPRPA